MSGIARNIAIPDLMAYLLESPESPTHIGAVQVFDPGKGNSQTLVKRIVEAFRGSEVDAPFKCVPQFPTFGRARWLNYENYDPLYHVRQLALPTPGNTRQLLDVVADLHTGMMDRSYPGFMVYVIEGLEHGKFALYWKVHHAYIDGGGMVMRMSAMMADTAKKGVAIRPLWAPLPELATAHAAATAPAERSGRLKATHRVMREMSGLAGQSLLQAGGLRDRKTPLPFTAGRSLFNGPLRPARRLGVESLDLGALKTQARARGVTINDIVLTLVGAALERYSEERGEPVAKTLVAGCPMAVRRAGEESAGNQIVALTVMLGEPGCDIAARLDQVHASASDAKEDARSVSREALMGFQMMVGGVSELMGHTRWGDRVPPMTNVNVSNVAGPRRRFYLAGCRMVQTFRSLHWLGVCSISPLVRWTKDSISRLSVTPLLFPMHSA